MTHFQTITLCNFLSVGNVPQTVDLSIGGLTLVLGENADIGGANSRNGVGKSTLWQAISYVLFGKPLTKIRVSNLVNNINNKAMLVTIDFQANGKQYRIERGQKPNVMRWFVDGNPVSEAQGENKQTQIEIENVLGMSHNMFRHIVALNTTTTPFLREESAKQREIIEELLGITLVSQKAEALKKQMDSTKEQVRDEEARVNAESEANARIEKAIERAQQEAETWQSKQDRLLAELLETAETVTAIDIDAELAVFDQIDNWNLQKREIDERRRTTQGSQTQVQAQARYQHAELARLKEEARATDSGEINRLERQAQSVRREASQDIQPQIGRLEADADRYRRDAERHGADQERLTAERDSLTDRLAHGDQHTCSTCGQGLVGTDHLATVLANLQTDFERVSQKVAFAAAAHTAALAAANERLDEIEQIKRDHVERRCMLLAQAEEIDAEIVLVKQAQRERAERAAQALAGVQQQIEELGSQERTIQSALTDLEAQLRALGPVPRSAYSSRDEVRAIGQERESLLRRIETEMARTNPHAAKVDTLRGTLAIINYDRLHEASLRLKHEAFLYKLLTAKDSFVRKQIIDQNLAYLNARLNHYLEHLGLPHEVTFMPDLSVEITIMGRDFDFDQLSTGERNRVVLATSWAFRDIWEDQKSGFSLVLVDELIDSGMDDAGAEAALAILQTMAMRNKSVFLISHKESLVSRADRTLTVRKEHQFTSFLEAA